MSRVITPRSRRKAGSAEPTRAVSLSSLRPVPDPFRHHTSTHLNPDPDEFPPACPECGDPETMWHVDRRSGEAVLVCRACVDAVSCPEAPNS